MLRLFNRLSGKLDTSRLPSRSGEIGDYLKNFEHAVRFTRSCGFKEAPPNWIERDLLDTEGTFIEPSFRAAGVVDPAMAAGLGVFRRGAGDMRRAGQPECAR